MSSSHHQKQNMTEQTKQNNKKKKVNTRKHCSNSQPAEGDKDQHVCVEQDLGSKFKYQINNSRTRKRKIPASSDLQGTARKRINLHKLFVKKFIFFSLMKS